MRPTHTIEALLGSRSRLAVLRVLHGVAVPLNASQLAGRTGLSWTAVSTVLDELAEMGITNSSSAGRANIHTLNRESIYVTDLIDPLFAAEERIPDEVLADLRGAFESHALAMVLFGSYARGEQASQSDVDVAIVAVDAAARNLIEETVDGYLTHFLSRFGAPFSAIVYDAEEAAALSDAAPSFAARLADEALVVFGAHPREWSDLWRS
jgi:predicted nucleotidyltransferase